ncbi:TIGR03773 family transporter-associated surface protein [Jiangella anatolica]|nr:TIGR03773 family transporter-associated surface protein [Jiangella anatolica]
MHRSLVRKIVGVAGSAALLAALPAAVPLAGAEPGTPPPADERRVLTTEHVDAVNVGFDGERLTVNAKIGPPVEHVAVDDLVFQVSDLALIEGLPEQYAEFLGTDAAWVIQQTQNPDVLWAGWSTEELGAGVVDGDAVDITLTDVRGPGEVEVFQTSPFGEPIRIFSSDEDHTTLRQGIGAHVHANWAFTEPGVYTVTFTVSATVAGQPVSSGPVDYTWVIGGENGALPTAAPSVTAVQAPGTAVVGEEVVLEAGVTTDPGSGAPPAAGGHVQFHDGETALGWASLTDGRATLPVTFDEPGEHSVTATYSSQEPQFYAPSTSEPVTVTVEEGDVDPPATTLTIAGPGAAVPAGEPVTLTVSQDPPTGLTAYQWSTRAPGALTFETVDGATTDTLTVTPSAADDGRQYRAALSTDDGAHVAYSAPYTLTVEDDDPPPQCEDPRVVLDHEHVDLISPRLTGGELVLEAKVGEANDHVFYAPDDVLVHLKDPEARVAVPDLEEYAFLGEPGAPLWLIPQTQDPEVVWAGWSTEELALGAFRDDIVHLTLRGVEGPGGLEVFSYDEGGMPRRIFSSTAALDPWPQPVPMHSHANWAFTALGEYTVTFEVSGTLADGTEVTTGPVDYAFVVGDVECDPGEPGDETGGDESGGDESGGDESGGDESGGDESGGDESGGDESGGDESGGDESGGDESGADGGTTTPTPDPTTTSTTTPTTKPTTKVCVPRPSSTGTGGSSAPSDPGGGTSGDPVVLTTEHVDLLAPSYESGRMSLRAKVGSAADHTYYDPADVLVNVVPAAASTVPSGDNYAFLGTAGAPLWLIPETQNPEVVWAGWSTEDLAAGTFAGDAVDMRLVSAEGPGTVEVFQTTGFGDIARIFSSEESLPARHQSVGQHVHANWAFSAEGSYTLTFEVSGTAGGEAVTTGPVEYTFVVGELSGARNALASGAGAAAPAVYRTQPTVTQVDSTPTPSPTPTPTPSASPSPTAADCDLASTGTSSTPALTVLGGLLVAGGAVAMAAYWRDRRAARV